MFPKMGKVFPEGGRAIPQDSDYAKATGAALRADLGETHQAVKILMRWTGANERTVKNWLAGKHGPSGTHLIGLVRHSKSVLEVLLVLAGQEQKLAVLTLSQVRAVLAETLQKIDSFMAASL